MKSCIKCKEVKQLGEFYKHKQMADGHVNKCKECVKGYQRSRDVREYDRNRPNAAERVKRNCERERLKYKNDPEYRLLKLKKQRESRKKNRVKFNARNLLLKAVMSGKVVRSLTCERCSCSSKLHGHHEDYSKPLDVLWLCMSCHGKRHKELNEILRKDMPKTEGDNKQQ